MKRCGSTQVSSPDDCNELLELAAQGGIQFVRATEDGRYEVMTNSEARELMAQNSHDVTILDGEEAEAINLVNMRQNAPEASTSQENQIMVLDPMKPEKNVSMNSIEILRDKEIQILDKTVDDRFEEEMSFLSQPKMDDLTLEHKFDDAIAVVERDVDGKFDNIDDFFIRDTLQGSQSFSNFFPFVSYD